MASEAVRQRLYLIQELEVSMVTIDTGLAELQASKSYQSRHFVFLLLLSTGLERLLKIILHLRELETRGSFLPVNTMKTAYNHQLVKLLDVVITECFTVDYLRRPVASVDLAFIRNDVEAVALLNLLSAFAKDERYIYMNGISDPSKVGESPQQRWEQLEIAMMPAGAYVALYGAGREHEAKRHANQALSACIERLVRALARLFAFGVFGDLGRQVSPLVVHYANIRDEDLGTRRRLPKN